MEDPCVCYRLHGKAHDGESVTYIGHVQVLPGQSNEAAVHWRHGKHLESLKHCLQGLKPSTARSEPIGVKLPRREALLQELALAVVAWKADARARGGPFVFKHLRAEQIRELQELSPVCDAASWTEKRRLVQKIASRFSERSSARCHIENRCFKCGAKDWTKCACKRSSIETSLLPSAPGSSACGPGRPRKAVSQLPSRDPGRSRKAVPCLPSRGPGRPRKAVRKPRKRRDRRGEKSPSGNQKRKARGITCKSPACKKQKWGENPADAIKTANQNYKPKRKTMKAAMKKK